MATHATHAAHAAPRTADGVDELRRRAWEILGALTSTAVGCLAALIVLMPDGTSSNDMQRLALLSMLAGALGAAVSAIVLLCDRYQAGFALADGSVHPPSEKPRARFHDGLVPYLALRPVLGAVMGLIVYAGFVGGFLIATTTNAPTHFSPQGIVFASVLSGLFAKTFLARMRMVFKSLLGEDAKDAAA